MKALAKLKALCTLLLATTTFAHTVKLTCDPIAGAMFNFYRSTVSGRKGTLVNPAPLPTCDYVDTMVVSGTIYYYVATDIVGGTESNVSKEAIAAVSPDAPTNLQKQVK